MKINTYKKILLSGTVLASMFVSGVALAASNPAGSGQPGAECGAEEGNAVAPKGFSSKGFENAETRYAGEDDTASLAHSKSGKAVSQYDVACYQLSN